jgi:hypothetical protein
MKLPAPAPEKTSFSASKNLARKVLCVAAMSSLENIYKIMAESAAGADALHETAQKFDSARHISPAVAHELNNIIAIIQGYADRLLFKHGENPALEPHLKLISEAAKRAAIIVHDAMPPNPSPASGKIRRRRNSPPRNDGFFRRRKMRRFVLTLCVPSRSVLLLFSTDYLGLL